VQIKAGGMVYPALTDDAGNFNFAAGTVPGMFTATVVVSGCPAVMTMPDALVSGGDPTDKNCNGCHGPGGGQQPITL
jgi:mono/diheme cytochrome c family protein